MSLIGRHIGRYRIVEQLGQGGMSVVYKGVDTALDREVAVKVLHPHLAQRAESRKRLEREAKAVARLRHPNILEVYDYANESVAEAFIVTELIRGKTLREFISAEALQPPEVAAMVVHELASALAHAHELGVLHRDLKPENVMVRDDGLLKLMDFGIAKILDRDEKMTVTGALVGSPAHMAPEIIEGEEAGAEADVFSLGTMLYLFATGRLPFVAPNTTATLKKILDCAYDDPRQVVPTVSDGLADIISTCLQRSPADRFPTAGKLRDALADLLGEVGLHRPHEELPRFFLDPRGYRKELTERLTVALLAQAEQRIAEKRPAKALASLNQVLAHDPNNAKASALLLQMRARKVREQRVKRLRLVAALGAGVTVLGGVGAWGLAEVTRPPDLTLKPKVAPWDVTFGGVAWPPKELAQEATVDAGVAELPATDAGSPRPVMASNVRPPALRPAGSEALDVTVMVRPFGYVQVDDGPRSAEAQTRHQLRLTAGRHRFAVSCELCESPARVVERAVTKGEEVALIAQLKPSAVTFRGYPVDARVRVGSEERLASESLDHPFKLVTPPGGSLKMQHQLEYVVTANGVELERSTRWIAPGTAVVVERGTAP